MGLGVSTQIIQIKPSPHSNTLTGSPKVNAEVINDPTLPDPIQDDSALPQDLALLQDMPTKKVK